MTTARSIGAVARQRHFRLVYGAELDPDGGTLSVKFDSAAALSDT